MYFLADTRYDLNKQDEKTLGLSQKLFKLL